MLKIITVPAALVAATAIAAPASAQVIQSGPRIEGQVGWDWVKAQDDFGGEYKNDGLLYGVGAGYDIGLAGFALGLDVEASKSDIKDVVTYVEGGETVTATLENGRDLYVGGRATFPIGLSTKAYVKAGYSNLKNTLDFAYDDGSSVVRETFSDTEDGIRVGAGLQQSIAANAYLGGEYRYTSYNSDLDKHQLVGTLGLSF